MEKIIINEEGTPFQMFGVTPDRAKEIASEQGFLELDITPEYINKVWTGSYSDAEKAFFVFVYGHYMGLVVGLGVYGSSATLAGRTQRHKYEL